MFTGTASHSPNGVKLGVIRLLWAISILLVPRKLFRLIGNTPDSTSVAIARILGARQLAQAAVEVTMWPRWRRLGIAVDVAHAGSAVAFARFDIRWRRIWLIDSVVATAFAFSAVRFSEPP